MSSPKKVLASNDIVKIKSNFKKVNKDLSQIDVPTKIKVKSPSVITSEVRAREEIKSPPAMRPFKDDIPEQRSTKLSRIQSPVIHED